ncbi:hypothetical protein MD484_g4420, partial [Candolleomyces efflorescens]
MPLLRRRSTSSLQPVQSATSTGSTTEKKHQYSPVKLSFSEKLRRAFVWQGSHRERLADLEAMRRRAAEMMRPLQLDMTVEELTEVEDMHDRMIYAREQYFNAKDRGKRAKGDQWMSTLSATTKKYERFAIGADRSELRELVKKKKANAAGKAQSMARSASIPEQESSEAPSEPMAAMTHGRGQSYISVKEYMIPSPASANEYVTMLDRYHRREAVHDHGYWPSVYSQEDRKALEATLPPIIQWLEATTGHTSRIYWLWQKGERGRDNPLRYVANKCGKYDALASSFFFSSDQDLSTSAVFAPTIANELTRYIPEFGDILKSTSMNRGSFIFGKGIVTQVKELVVDTFKKLPQLCRQKPLLVVINSLDRCAPGLALHILDAIEYCVERMPIFFMISSLEADWLVSRTQSWGLRSRTTTGVYMELE